MNLLKINRRLEKFITDSQWAYWYCKYVKDRPEIRKYITKSRWAYYYCVDVMDRPEIRKYIKKHKYCYHYCPEVRRKVIMEEGMSDVARSNRII